MGSTRMNKKLKTDIRVYKFGGLVKVKRAFKKGQSLY
jgi:hypothetical protein